MGTAAEDSRLQCFQQRTTPASFHLPLQDQLLQRRPRWQMCQVFTVKVRMQLVCRERSVPLCTDVIVDLQHRVWCTQPSGILRYNNKMTAKLRNPWKSLAYALQPPLRFPGRFKHHMLRCSFTCTLVKVMSVHWICVQSQTVALNDAEVKQTLHVARFVKTCSALTIPPRVIACCAVFPEALLLFPVCRVSQW